MGPIVSPFGMGAVGDVVSLTSVGSEGAVGDVVSLTMVGSEVEVALVSVIDGD